jgi:hypothetical protein
MDIRDATEADAGGILRKVGHLRAVGRKFDRWLDLVFMQLIMEDPAQG